MAGLHRLNDFPVFQLQFGSFFLALLNVSLEVGYFGLLLLDIIFHLLYSVPVDLLILTRQRLSLTFKLLLPLLELLPHRGFVLGTQEFLLLANLLQLGLLFLLELLNEPFFLQLLLLLSPLLLLPPLLLPLQ